MIVNDDLRYFYNASPPSLHFKLKKTIVAFHWEEYGDTIHWWAKWMHLLSFIKWKWLTPKLKFLFSFTMWLDPPTPTKTCQYNFLVKCVTNFLHSIPPRPFWAPAAALQARCAARHPLPPSVWLDAPLPWSCTLWSLVLSFTVVETFLQKLPEKRCMGSKCSEILGIWKCLYSILTLDWKLFGFSLYLWHS